MEFVGQERSFEVYHLLEVPGFSSLDVDDDEGEVVIGIRPKSSPLPRRKSSVSDEDSEPEPPLCGSRRVSFADAKGLSLVQVKEFEMWDVPNLPRFDFCEGEGKDKDKCYLSLLTFSLPLPTEELFVRVQDQKVELETIELLPGTTILKGVIRVLNISFNKAVYVRATLDNWSSYFDLLAEYIPGSSDGLMDCFSFKLTLIPPFGEQGARVDFCLRYETPVGTFWANNNHRNYVLFCHQRMKELKETPQKESVNKKSCLKPVSQSPTVENISMVDASFQENISTVVAKQGDEVKTVKDKQISDDQSGASEDDEQKLRADNRQNRSRRKTARMARVRDYFAQRDGGENDTGRDESPPAEKQEEEPTEKQSEMHSFSVSSNKSEGFQFVSESLETRSEPLADVLNDTPQAHNYTSNSEPGKSENNNLADTATLTGGESAMDIPDNSLHSNEEPASAERQNINKSVSKTEGENIKQDVTYEHVSNVGFGPADSVILGISSESLDSQTSSFTSETVAAPLCHTFVRMEGENQSLDEMVNPLWSSLNIRNITQRGHHTEIGEISFGVATDTSVNDKVQENMIKTQESDQECLDGTSNSPSIEEQTSVTAKGIVDHADVLHDPVEIIHSGDSKYEIKPISTAKDVHPNSGNILNAPVPKESSYPHGEAQEDNVTCDLQRQALTETALIQLPERKCSQFKSNPDDSETQEVIAGVETSLLPHQASLGKSECVSDETEPHASRKGEHVSKHEAESNTDYETCKTITISTADAIPDDKILEALNDLNPNNTDNSVAEESSCISCCETHETSLETQEEIHDVEKQNKLTNYFYEDETKQSAENEVSDEVAESATKAGFIHGDKSVKFRDDDKPRKSGKTENREIEVAVSKQEDFSFTESAKGKNWEMMVEEEETTTLRFDKEGEAVSLKAEDNEAVMKDKGGQLEDTDIETAFENRDAKEREKEKGDEELVAEITTTTKLDFSEDRQSAGKQIIEEIMDEKNDEFLYVQGTWKEIIDGEDEPVDEMDVEEQGKKVRHFTEMQEASTERSNVQKGEAKEEMEKDQAKPREKAEGKNQYYREEKLVDAGEAEVVDAESDGVTLEGVEDKVVCFEERLDVTQNKAEDSLSAPVNNLYNIDKGKSGEGHHAHIPTQMQFFKEEHFQTDANVTHDRSKAENASAAAEGCLCISADEPESDQTSQNSTSAESDSDDEVELYMHCLRAVHTGTEAQTDRNKDAGFTVRKRPSVSKSKSQSTPMPSISESLDEEQHLSCIQGNNGDMEKIDSQPTASAGGQEHITSNVSWWKETFSCSKISKTLLYVTLLAVFLVVAYHYDFLACFGLYLISVIWLCCQGESQPVKNNNKLD